MSNTFVVRICPFLIVSLLTATAIYSPETLFFLGKLSILLIIILIAFLFPTMVLALSVISLVFSLENFLYFNQLDLPMNVGAVHKLLVLTATIPTVVRFGINWQLNTPVIAILLLLVTSLLIGDLHYALTKFQILKSLIALLIPWLFLSVKFDTRKIDTLLVAIALMPMISVLIAIPVELIGPLNVAGKPFQIIQVDYSGGARLKGMNFPAFLAFFGFIAYFVCIQKVFVEGRRKFVILALINLGLIIFSGTRMPSLLALMLSGIAILLVSKEGLFGASRAQLLFLGLLFVSIVFLLYWPQLEARMFAHSSDTMVNLSGRDDIWSRFYAAFQKSPLFGMGVGAGVVLLDDVVVYTSKAAHNEYLRLLVDSGIVGLFLYIFGVIVYLSTQAKYLTRDEKVVIFGFFGLLSIYSITDNTLTATPTLVMGIAVALILQKAREKHSEELDTQSEGEMR